MSAEFQIEANLPNTYSLARIRYRTVVYLIAIHFGAFLVLWPAFWTWQGVAALIGMYWLCAGLGLSFGFHRLLSHRSFCTVKGIEYLVSWLGSLNWQGSPATWAAVHRRHHRFADQPGDPHSPTEGFGWAHVHWLYRDLPARECEASSLPQDLTSDLGHRLIGRFAWASQFFVGGLLYLWGGWPAVVWGVFVRLVLVYHLTWFQNSAAHTWGYRRYRTLDRSRNLWWLALLSFGEWHHNHHAVPGSARQGHHVWELDLTWWTICVLGWFGLVWNHRRPTHHSPPLASAQ